MAAPLLPAAGWYPDPTTPGGKRYWDGAAWTEKTVPVGNGVAGSLPTKPPLSKTIGGISTNAIVAGTVIADLSGL